MPTAVRPASMHRMSGNTNSLPRAAGYLVVFFLTAAATSAASAQALSDPLRGAEVVSEAAQLDAKREGRARFFDPEDGQFDLSYFLENPRGFLPIPIVVTEPAVGYGG